MTFLSAEQATFNLAQRRVSELSDREAAERYLFLEENLERLSPVQEWELRLLEEWMVQA